MFPLRAGGGGAAGREPGDSHAMAALTCRGRVSCGAAMRSAPIAAAGGDGGGGAEAAVTQLQGGRWSGGCALPALGCAGCGERVLGAEQSLAWR